MPTINKVELTILNIGSFNFQELSKFNYFLIKVHQILIWNENDISSLNYSKYIDFKTFLIIYLTEFNKI